MVTVCLMSDKLQFVVDFVSTTCGSRWVIGSVREAPTHAPATAGNTDLTTN